MQVPHGERHWRRPAWNGFTCSGCRAGNGKEMQGISLGVVRVYCIESVDQVEDFSLTAIQM